MWQFKRGFTADMFVSIPYGHKVLSLVQIMFQVFVSWYYLSLFYDLSLQFDRSMQEIDNNLQYS